MVRMRLNWRGGPTSISGVAGTYRIIVILTAVYWSVYIVLTIMYNGIVTAATPEGTPTADDVTSLVMEPLPTSAVIISNIRSLLPFAFWVYMIVLLIRTRMAVRAKYAIPDKCCPGCEDVVCAICCGCCTTMQMSRHTAEYDKYASQCCTETGLPAHVKSMA
jgi:Cys-rich protein (TIGR01571 family)